MIGWVLWLLEWSGNALAIGLVVAAIGCWLYVPVIGRNLATGLLVAAAAALFLRHAYADGIAHERADWEAKLARETTRRETIITELHKTNVDQAGQLVKAEAARAELMKGNSHASAAADSTACLDAASVRRLQQIGR